MYWREDGDPFCVRLEDAVAYTEEQKHNSLLISKVADVYDSLLGTTPGLIMNALIQGTPSPMSDLFAVNATGRVDPVGEFSGFEGIVEYFYGSVWDGQTQVTKVTFKKLLAQGNYVASRVDLTFQSGAPFFIQYNLTQTGVFTFNSDNLVQSTELIIHNLGWVSDPFLPKSDLVVNFLCYTILVTANCTADKDPLGYYTDMQDCVNFMNAIEWGSLGQARSNSTSCRYYHSTLAVARPVVHCPHAGKTGGSKCIPHVYNDYYLTN